MREVAVAGWICVMHMTDASEGPCGYALWPICVNHGIEYALGCYCGPDMRDAHD